MHADYPLNLRRRQAAAAALLSAMLAAGCLPRADAPAARPLPGRPAPDNAAVIAARAEVVPVRLDLVGTVASANRVNISARIPAHVNEMFVSAGQAVPAGHLLLTLDDREIREQAGAAEAQLKQAEAEYKRARQLFETQAATEQALTAAESMFNAAKAQMERMRVMLSYAQITSPIAGIVTDRRVEAGDLTGPGQLLMAIYDPHRMRLEVPAPLRLIEKLQLGQEVEVTLERPSRKFAGRVAEIVAEIDPMSRTQLVRVDLEDNTGTLLPGTFGRLWVNADERRQILLPAGAVYRSGQLEFVQVLEHGRRLTRLVKTGPRYGEQVAILSGLADGEQVLAQPVLED